MFKDLKKVFNRVSILQMNKNKKKFKILTLDRGSLGSWVDEDRSKLRVAM
jgi:hypothetical protein